MINIVKFVIHDDIFPLIFEKLQFTNRVKAYI